MSQPDQPMSASRPPHPTLKQYYPSDHDRRAFIADLFDGAAEHYDRVCRLMSFGSGDWYRRRALQRAGLRPGMKLLDLATGTGLVVRAATRVLSEPGAVIGLDPSTGMLRRARAELSGLFVQGLMEQIPFRAECFDLLTIGYALRHAADLDVVFRECLRVLKPGGRLLVLEISRASSAGGRRAMWLHFTQVLPFVMRLSTRNKYAQLLTRYYWDTIATCIPSDAIVDALQGSGFVRVEYCLLGGVLSEYVATKAER
jgi:demethylmenaquinone methyltransferase/2-methoxy-6-polyprenyl-1,4-benzoquinol methylase